MTSIGAQIELGTIPSGGKKGQFLGIAEDEDDESLLVTSSEYHAFTIHTQSKSRAKTFTIPREYGPLDGPLLWSNRTSRYVALGRNGTVLLYWTSGKSSENSSSDSRSNRPTGKMKTIELSQPAWRILHCGGSTEEGRPRCPDNLWLVYPNGYTVSVADFVEKSIERKDKKSYPSKQAVKDGELFSAGEKDGLTISNAAVFCENGHRVALLVGTQVANSEHIDPFTIELIESPLGSDFTPRRRRLLDSPASQPVVNVPAENVQTRNRDEEGSDEGFIDSMDTRMTDEDSNGPTAVVTTEAKPTEEVSASGQPGFLLSSSFCTHPENPGLLTLWEDTSVRSFSLTETLPEVPVVEFREEGMMETGLSFLFSLNQNKMTAERNGRPSIYVLDAERFLVHAFGMEGDIGSMSIWNFRHGGICEDYKTMKMFDPMSWSCRVGGFALAKNYVAFTIGRAAFATAINMAPSSKLSEILGFAVVPAFRGNFASSTFLNVPCAFGSGDGIIGYKRIIDAEWEKPMPIHHLAVPEESGDKVVASYIREGRVEELIRVLSDEKQFLRESLVISSLKLALDLQPDPKHGLDEDRIQGWKSRLLQAVIRQPVAKSYLKKRLASLNEEKAFDLLMELVRLMDESCPIWRPDGNGYVVGGVPTIIEWLSAVVEGKFSSLMVTKLQEGEETGVMLQRKFKALAGSWCGAFKELRSWDGALAEVKRRIGETKACRNETLAKKARSSGLLGGKQMVLGGSAPRNYRVRVISDLW